MSTRQHTKLCKAAAKAENPHTARQISQSEIWSTRQQHTSHHTKLSNAVAKTQNQHTARQSSQSALWSARH